MTTELIPTTLNKFGLEAPYKIQSITSGLINPTWKIQSGDREYILQKINTAVFNNPENIALNLDQLDQFLKQRHPDYLFVAPLKTSDGNLLCWMEGGCFRLFPFVKDSHTIDVVSNPNEGFEAAKQFAKFTRLLSDFDTAQLRIAIPDFHNLSFREKQFARSIKEGNQERIAKSSDLIAIVERYHWVADTFEKIVQQKLIRPRVTHHDTKISNVLFNSKEKGLCVIDLDTVMPGYFISDFGDMMRTYLSPSSEESEDMKSIYIRDEYFAAIAEAFLGEMKDLLNEQERDFIVYAGFFMTYMQAIRFLADYFNNDSYYGAKYENHNYVRASNQLTLLQRMSEKRSSMETLLRQF